MTRRLFHIIAAQAFLAISQTAFAQGAPPAGIIRSFEVLSITPAYGGATPAGAAGPYEVITGIVHGALNPASPSNAEIVDLQNALRGSDGLVAYSTDAVILRPVHASDAKRVLFYDVVNRGRKLAVASFIGGTLDASPPPATFPSLLREGATIVWSGWQGDVAQTGNPSTAANGALGTMFPVAERGAGEPITGRSREEYIPDYAEGAANTIPLSYPPADAADRNSVIFTARQSWLTGYGTEHPAIETYGAPSVPVPEWHYAEGPNGTAVVFTPPRAVPGPAGKPVAPDAGTIYSFVYSARDPRVNGIGFAAVRDLVAFLRHDAADAEGHPNPLRDLRDAHCVLASCPASPEGNFDIAIGEGISQSGRFLRDFLYRGFNADGQGRPVFDGLMPIIAGARRTWIDERFSQPGRWSKEHEDHWQPGDQFPFAYNVITDPVTGQNDGLLRACTASQTCPRIMQIDGEFEWWGARASLVVTDGKGRDLKLPDNVRYYLVPGTQHGGGPGVSTGLFAFPAPGSLCQLPASPVAETPVERALVHALIDWAAGGEAPPSSQYPTAGAGTAQLPTDIDFPDLRDATVPNNGTPYALHLVFSSIYNQIFATEYKEAIPVVHPDKSYAVLVPKVDRNGNTVTGILVPDVKVPLATYTGWNYRGEGHAIGEDCTLNGAAIPFAVEAEADGHDRRATLASLYSGRADYVAKVAAAADDLVRHGYLLPADAENVFVAHARNVSPSLIPRP